ncbi:hypothetical protein [Streptomyces mirabilis]|uniref:hypothetical protein n=1 Tax=Streptomyces mirabilis TaxID=68239 RepID=UPI00369624FA
MGGGGGLGANALPQITGTVTLLGHNTTVRRDPDASDGFRIAEIDGPHGRLTVDSVTATGGGYLEYAGTYLPTDGATLILRHSTVTNSTANQGGAFEQGGGIANYGSSTLTKTVVQHNSALNGGGIWQAPSPSVLNLVNSQIVDSAPSNCRPVGSVPGCTS